MAAARSQRSDTLQHLCRLSDEHEILLLKRQTIVQMQKYKDIEFSSRKGEKKKETQEANKRNKQLLDDLSTCERHLKEASYSVSENRLELLRDHYFDLVKAKCPEWLQEIEAQRDNSYPVDD